MTTDDLTAHLERVLKSNQQFRRQLAELPITEKLRLLDALRERALDIQASQPRPTIADPTGFLGWHFAPKGQS